MREPPRNVWVDVAVCGANPTGIPRATRNMATALKEAGPSHGLTISWVVAGLDGRFTAVHTIPSPFPTVSPAGRVLQLARSLPLPPKLRGAAVRLLHWIRSRPLRAPAAPRPPGPPDVLLLPHAGSPALPRDAIETARQEGATIATVCWDILPLTRPDLFSPEDCAVFADAFYWLLPRTDILIAGSHATRTDIQQLALRTGHSLPRLAVCGAVIDLPAPATSLRRRLNLPADHPIAVMVGAFVPRKQHLLAVAAMERVWTAGVDAILLCLGPPHPLGMPIMERLRAHPEFGRRLLLVHDASDAEVAEAYHFATVALMPSEAEGFGMPIAEALLSGCPVLCADIPVFREIAGDVATLLPVGDTDSWASALRHHLTSRKEPPAPASPFQTRWRDAPIHDMLHILRTASPNDTRGDPLIP